MADLDEDVIPREGPDAAEIDLSDETQDFRFLSIVSRDDAKIPKRGEKDFEPHATALQSSTLDASRAAMHDALSFNRVHAPKKHILAVYDEASNMAYTDHPKSTLFKSIGKVRPTKGSGTTDPTATNRLWLLPEEALYLVERGTIDIRWPAPAGEPVESGLPMSLQGAYAVFIGASHDYGDVLTFERYSVYSALKRLGYAVHRSSTWNQPPETPTRNTYPASPGTWQSLGLTVESWRSWMSSLLTPVHDTKHTLLPPRLFRRYPDIYKSLALVPCFDPTTRSTTTVPAQPEPADPLRITYDVYKPNNTIYKKSQPGPPDFQIVVADGRNTSVPSLDQLDHLLRTIRYDPPNGSAQLYQKIRNGHKSVILAVVDSGVTNYIRVADAAFGRQRIYERIGAAPYKGKRSGPPKQAA